MNRWQVGVLPVLALLSACGGDAVSKDQRNSFLDVDDLVRMTDQMAAAIPSDPQVIEAQRLRPMVIVLRPIVNDTNEIIPGNEKELYVARVRSLLARQAALRGAFVFVLNRADYDQLKATEAPELIGPVEEGGVPAVGRLVPEYALTGTFRAATSVNPRQRSDCYLCEYRLIHIGTGAELWSGMYETRKSVRKQMLD